MTPRTNARLAGLMFLLYILTGITQMVLFNQATQGAGDTAATLANLARHAALVRVTVILGLLQAVYALVLGVTLFSLTRDQDPDLALLAMSFRVGEGVISAVSTVRALALLAVAKELAGAASGDSAAVTAVGAVLLRVGGFGTVGAFCFAVASTLFAYLFLRARSIPVVLAWLGLLASILWVIGLPLQLAGVLSGSATYILWIPMAVFEVSFALWLLLKGVAAPASR